MLKRKPYLILAALSPVVFALLGIAWHLGLIHWALDQKEPLLDWCRSNPFILFAAIAILPGFAFPVAPLLILAGVVWGSNPMACGLAMAAVLINITWSHLLASGFCQKYIKRILGNHWERWESMAETDHWRLALLLRITPGIPLCFQNYLLGLLGVPIRYSLGIAIPTTGLYVCGFVLTGGAIFEGKLGLLLLGISVLAAATLAVKITRHRLALRQNSQSSSSI